MNKSITRILVAALICLSLFAMPVSAAEEAAASITVTIPVSSLYKDSDVTVVADGTFSETPDPSSYVIHDGETQEVLLGTFTDPNDYTFVISDGITKYNVKVQITWDEENQKICSEVVVKDEANTKPDEIIFRGEEPTSSSSESSTEPTTVPPVITGTDETVQPYIFMAIGSILVIMLLGIFIAMRSRRNAEK